MIRAVPDVNIFVSLAIKKGGHPAQIFARIGEFISFTSEKILVACATEADADYIISGDHHLLDLKHYREIQIVAPAAFLDILDREKAFRIN